jgi:dihydroneopterin aldolase
MDKILMKKMVFYGYHGVFEDEKNQGQEFIVDMELMLDLSQAGKTDRVEDTVSYADVYQLVKMIVEGPSYNLIERLADELAGRVLENFNLIGEVQIKVRKPGAPVDGEFEYFGVEICRKRLYI